MEIVFYQKKYRQAFIDLNLAWLNKYFSVEPQDIRMLEGVEELLGGGAGVYFAVEEGRAIAACMVVSRGKGVWEICKLATDEKFQGRGAGSAVLGACMDYAAARGAKKLFIVSNRILAPAIRLYLKAGFREVPVEHMEYQRVDIQLERDL